jgi:hypothetical protein
MDFQSNSDGNYKFVMVYQDHLTQFCNIRALTSKHATEVAFNLIEVFTLFGEPHILQSDNGREFTALVISELKLMGPELVIVHGIPDTLNLMGVLRDQTATFMTCLLHG